MRNGKILVLGKNGQVGRALVHCLGQQALACASSEVNLLDADFISQLEAFVGDMPLSAVINAAAYTKVDLAEGEGREEAFRINASAAGELAVWCRRRALPLVHYSTDYVLPGEGVLPQTEDVTPDPLNVYGQSKLEGERAVIAAGGKYLIFRTSWVFDAEGKNFARTILRLIQEKEQLNIVADQVGAPTYAPHLARATLDGLEHAMDMEPFPSGIYHLCNAGETSWHEFAQAIFMLAREYESREYSVGLETGSPTIKCQQILPIPSSAYPVPAKRPLNSRLDTGKTRRVLGVTMPEWIIGLQECFETIHGSSECNLTGLKVIQLKLHGDSRGFFVERFRRDRFLEAGLPVDFVQDNHSRSAPGILRGLHYQHTPPQGKLVGVIRGRVLDVAVDIRPESPTFGQYHAEELSDDNGRLLWMPAGFAHGFCVLGDEPADMLYKVTGIYNGQGEGGIRYDDPAIAIDWPVENPLISERDKNLPGWGDYCANPPKWEKE